MATSRMQPWIERYNGRLFRYDTTSHFQIPCELNDEMDVGTHIDRMCIGPHTVPHRIRATIATSAYTCQAGDPAAETSCGRSAALRPTGSKLADDISAAHLRVRR